MKRNIFAALLLIISLVVIRDASANLLVNGDFEVPVQVAPIYATFNIPAGNPYITGWTIVQGNVDLTTTANYGAGPNDLDPSSVQDVDLIGDIFAPPGGAGGLSQSFATVFGQQYQLTFHYSQNNGSFSPVYAAQVTLADGHNSANTTLSYVVSEPYVGSSQFGLPIWELSSQIFTANSDLTLLSFINTLGGSQGGIYLDNVSVTPVGPSVPDSGSTLAMMLLGLFGLGFLAHRWRNPLCA